MPRAKSITPEEQTSVELVSEYIDTAYDNVKAVKDNLDAVILVSTDVAPQVPEIIAAGENAILAVNAVTSINASEANITQLELDVENHIKDFKTQYYGPLAVAPVLDPYGEPIGIGDMYFDTVLKRPFF